MGAKPKGAQQAMVGEERSTAVTPKVSNASSFPRLDPIIDGSGNANKSLVKNKARYSDHTVAYKQRGNGSIGRRTVGVASETKLDQVASRASAKTALPPGEEDDADFSRDASPARRLNHLTGPVPVTSFPTIEVWAGGMGRGAGSQQLNNPYGIFFVKGAHGGDGTLYVSDMLNHRVQSWEVSNGIGGHAHTVAGGNGLGRGNHQLRYPKGIFVDGAGNVFVADSGNHRVMRWAHGATVGVVVAGGHGVLLNKQEVPVGLETFCCRAGKKMGELQDPHGVSVDTGGRIYVADTGNDRVQRWTGQDVATVAGGGSSTDGNSTLKRPEGVHFFKSVLYVADSGNDRVMSWPENATVGTPIAGGRGRGAALTQLASPSAVMVDDSLQEDGVDVMEAYVCDTYNHRVVKHRLPGPWRAAEPAIVAGACLQNPTYISPCIGGGLHYPPNPGPDRIDPNTNRTDIINPSNTNPPIYHFWAPSGVFVGYDGRNLTIADTLNHRVLTWVEYR